MILFTTCYVSNRQHTPEQLAEVAVRLDSAIDSCAVGALPALLAERALLKLNTGGTDAALPDLQRILELARDGQFQDEYRWAAAELSALQASSDESVDTGESGE
jgi:hypothetical protein